MVYPNPEKEYQYREELLLRMQEMLEAIMQRNAQERQYIRQEEQLADGHLYVLFFLFKKGVCKASDIAHQLDISSGAVTGLTDKMLSMGLIHRERSEEDRRVVLLSLTEKGKETFNRLRAARAKQLNALFSNIETGDLEKLNEIYLKIVSKRKVDNVDV